MSSRAITAVPIAEVRAAQARIAPLCVRTPIVRCDIAGGPCELSLKLENLQPVGAFKVRPVGSAVLAKPAESLATGVYTASTGNSAVALAWVAKRLGINAAAVVIETAPEAKLARIRALGARIVSVSSAEWWRTIREARHPGEPGAYIDAVRDPAALAGNGTLGIEILEQLPQLDAIFVPFGGGGLACGIASAVRALAPRVKVVACELDTAQPLSAALRAGEVVTTECNPGFVSGIGAHTLLPEMWPLAKELLAGTVTVSLPEVAAAIKLLVQENKVIAEGAGAIPVAAALSGRHPYARVCAVVSGGNLGTDMLNTILAGAIPG